MHCDMNLGDDIALGQDHSCAQFLVTLDNLASGGVNFDSLVSDVVFT